MVLGHPFFTCYFLLRLSYSVPQFQTAIEFHCKSGPLGLTSPPGAPNSKYLTTCLTFLHPLYPSPKCSSPESSFSQKRVKPYAKLLKAKRNNHHWLILLFCSHPLPLPQYPIYQPIMVASYSKYITNPGSASGNSQLIANRTILLRKKKQVNSGHI